MKKIINFFSSKKAGLFGLIAAGGIAPVIAIMLVLAITLPFFGAIMYTVLNFEPIAENTTDEYVVKREKIGDCPCGCVWVGDGEPPIDSGSTGSIGGGSTESGTTGGNGISSKAYETDAVKLADDIVMTQEQSNNMRKVYLELKQAGFSDAATYGIMGNSAQESLWFRYDIESGNKKYFGLFQINKETYLPNLQDFASSKGLEWKSIEAQVRWLDYMLLEGDEKNCFKTYVDNDKKISSQEFKQLTDSSLACDYFMAGFERCTTSSTGGEHGTTAVRANQYYQHAKNRRKFTELIKGYFESGTKTGSSTGVPDNHFNKFSVTDEELLALTAACIQEQGATMKGIATEASLMANLCDRDGKTDVYKYVRYGSWFAKATKNAMDNAGSAGIQPEQIALVKSVLVDGKRTLPKYIDEHDYFGDITSVVTDGNNVTSQKRDKTVYKQFNTVIKNSMGSTYTFYVFGNDTASADPFGYTSETKRQQYGDFHYDLNGNPVTDSNTASINVTSDMLHRTMVAVDGPLGSLVDTATDAWNKITGKGKYNDIIGYNDVEAWQFLSGGEWSAMPSYSSSVIQAYQQKHCKTIQIRVWDWENRGDANNFNKISKNKNITVNSYLADMIHQIFEDIYADPSKPVIQTSNLYSISNRSKRSGKTPSAHCFGTAFDLNPDSSVSFNGATYGNIYSSGVTHTTIDIVNQLPETKKKYELLCEGGVIVNTFKKYSFTWGGDFKSTKDGMHVSYVGDTPNGFNSSRESGIYNAQKYGGYTGSGSTGGINNTGQGGASDGYWDCTCEIPCPNCNCHGTTGVNTGDGLSLVETPGEFQGLYSDENGKALSSSEMWNYVSLLPSAQSTYLQTNFKDYVGVSNTKVSNIPKLTTDKWKNKFGDSIGIIMYPQWVANYDNVSNGYQELAYKFYNGQWKSDFLHSGCGLCAVSSVASTMLHKYISPCEVGLQMNTYNQRHNTSIDFTPGSGAALSNSGAQTLLNEYVYGGKAVFDTKMSGLTQSIWNETLDAGGMIIFVGASGKNSNTGWGGKGNHFVVCREKVEENGETFYLMVDSSNNETHNYGGINLANPNTKVKWEWIESYIASSHKSDIVHVKPGAGYEDYLKNYNQGGGQSNSGSTGSLSGGESGSNTSTGAYDSWKQSNSEWKSMTLGSSSTTCGAAGCFVTSVAIQIARSGDYKNGELKDNFTPGTFLEYANTHGGFSRDLFKGNLDWASGILKNFKFSGKDTMTYNLREEDSIKKFYNDFKGKYEDGEYIIIEIDYKGDSGGDHFIAVTSFDETAIKVADPGKHGDDLVNNYSSADKLRIISVRRYKCN